MSHLPAVSAQPPPTRLRIGAVLGGFDVEGGYNGPGEPANSWCWWEIEGRSSRRPAAVGFWHNWEKEVVWAAAAGCDSARVCIEWARCEPLDGRLDRRAVAAYCRLLDCCHEHGLQPAVTLHRFAHPAWMGVDFWLRPDSPERFRRWVETAVDHFAGRSHHWVTIDQLNVCALWAYLAGRNPPGRRLDVGATIRCLDHLLAAHVLAYEVITERQPQAVVSTGNRSLPVYELDRLLVDILLGRSAGVGRHELGTWLAERRQRFLTAGGGATARTALAWVVRQWAASAIPLEQALARAVAAVYDSPCSRSIDVLEVGGEDHDLDHVLPFPLSVVGREESSGLRGACRINAGVGLPLSVQRDAAAGMEGFRSNLAEVEQARAEGAYVTAFYQRMAPPAPGREPSDVRVVPRLRRRGVPSPT